MTVQDISASFLPYCSMLARYFPGVQGVLLGPMIARAPSMMLCSLQADSGCSTVNVTDGELPCPWRWTVTNSIIGPWYLDAENELNGGPVPWRERLDSLQLKAGGGYFGCWQLQGCRRVVLVVEVWVAVVVVFDDFWGVARVWERRFD